jgi:hypothetical protein
MNTSESTHADGFCNEIWNSTDINESCNCSLQDSVKVIGATDMQAVCVPNMSVFDANYAYIPIGPFYYNKRLKLVIREYQDEYTSSFDTFEFTFLQFGFYGNYLKAVEGSSYSAALPLGPLAYVPEVVLTPYLCPDPCGIETNNTQVTIKNPANSTYSLSLRVYNTSYITSFTLATYLPQDLQLNSYPDIYYPISVVCIPIYLVDTIYPNVSLHQFNTTEGIIDIQDSIYLYVPLTSRKNVSLGVKNIGGASANLSIVLNTNHDPVIDPIPVLYGWVGCYIAYNVTATDQDMDILSFNSTLLVYQNTLAFESNQIGVINETISVTVLYT